MERLIWNSSEEETLGMHVAVLVGKEQGQEVGVLAYRAPWIGFLGKTEERAFARAVLWRMVMKA